MKVNYFKGIQVNIPRQEDIYFFILFEKNSENNKTRTFF